MTQAFSSNNHTPAVVHPALFLSSLSFFFLVFMLPIYSKSLGASALTIGGLYAVFTVTTAIVRPVVGWALDHYGRKRFFVAAMMSSAVAMGLFAFASGIGGLYLARLVQGIAASLRLISAQTIGADLSSPEDRGKTMGRIGEISARAGIIGVFAGIFAMETLGRATGWQVVFMGYAAMAVVGMALAWQRVPETRPPVPLLGTSSGGLSHPLLWLLLIVFTTGASEALIRPIYIIFLQDKFTTDIGTLAWAFLPSAIVASVLPSRLGGLSDRFGRAPLMAAGILVSGIGSLLLPSIPNLTWLIVLYTLQAVGLAMASPAVAAMVADLTGSDMRGRAYGMYQFALNVGATLGPLLGGWLYDAAGQSIPFYLNGAVLCASAVGVVFLLKPPTQSTTETQPGLAPRLYKRCK